MSDGQDKRTDDQTVKVSNEALRDLRASATTLAPDAPHDESTRSLDRRNLDALIKQERDATQAEPSPGEARRVKRPSEPAHEVLTREVTPVLNPTLTSEAQERSYSQEVTAAVPSEVLAKLREGAPAIRLKAPTQHNTPDPAPAPKPPASDAWDDFDDSFLESSLGTESSLSALELTTSALPQALICDQDELATTRKARGERASAPEATPQPEPAARAPHAADAPRAMPRADVAEQARDASPPQAAAQEKTPEDAQRVRSAPITPQPQVEAPLAAHDGGHVVGSDQEPAQPPAPAPQAQPAEAQAAPLLIPAPASQPAPAPEAGISRLSLGLGALLIIALLLLGALALSGKIG